MVRPHQAFGSALKAMREARGFKLRDLATAMKQRNDGDALGLEAPELSKLERGKRGVTIEQWLLLAAALDCPPLLLVVPLGGAESIRIAATSDVHPYLAMEWLSGRENLARSDQYGINRERWRQMRLPLTLYERLHDVQVELRTLDQPWTPADPDEVEVHYRRLAETLGDMRVAGVLAPDQPPFTIGRLVEFGHAPRDLGVEIHAPDHWYRDRGERVPMRHPRLAGDVDIPALEVEGYERAGWRVAR